MVSATKHKVLRIAFGFFAVYLGVMMLAMLSPGVFDLVMGLVGLSWPRPPSREIGLLANMSLCGLVPTAFMAARIGLLGEWTALHRAFFVCMLGANLAINVWSVAQDSAFGAILAGDFALVAALLTTAIVIRPLPAGGPPPG